MKVGDLVVLSAYGKKLNMYKFRRNDCKTGLIIRKSVAMFHVLWNSGRTDTCVAPKDLKMAKKI